MWCKLDDLEVHYESFGEGCPIVFLHGWPLDHHVEAADYEPIFTRRAGWQRVYPDLPGMGQTPTRHGIDNQDRILEIVLQFLDRLLKGRRFVLAGTSLGAYLARGAVRDLAHRIDGLMLRVPLIVPADDRRRRPAFRALIEDAQAMAALAPAERVEMGEILVQRAGYIDALRHKLRTFIRPAERMAASASADIRKDSARYGLSFDVDALAAPFPAPTLIITGRQDTSVGYRDAWEILENFPRATFAVLDRADHGWPVDQRRLFEALIEDWLDRIEEYRAATHR
jgi:pimeloyl-ACP methyl ester carboxylesterase